MAFPNRSYFEIEAPFLKMRLKKKYLIYYYFLFLKNLPKAFRKTF